jgi:hypothetical protein
MNWPTLLTGQVETFQTPGGHMDMTKEEIVSRWGVRLKAAIVSAGY